MCSFFPLLSCTLPDEVPRSPVIIASNMHITHFFPNRCRVQTQLRAPFSRQSCTSFLLRASELGFASRTPSNELFKTAHMCTFFPPSPSFSAFNRQSASTFAHCASHTRRRSISRMIGSSIRPKSTASTLTSHPPSILSSRKHRIPHIRKLSTEFKPNSSPLGLGENWPLFS